MIPHAQPEPMMPNLQPHPEESYTLPQSDPTASTAMATGATPAHASSTHSISNNRKSDTGPSRGHDHAPDPVQESGTIMQALKALAGACSKEDLQKILRTRKGSVLGETQLVHFIDTGGQAIYHDVHPVLITSPSVYLVVFNLKEIYDKRRSEEEQLKYFRSDLIQRPLRSIYTFGTKNPQEKTHLKFLPEAPTVFIVGTHLDQMPQANCEDFFLKLHDMISEEIGNKPYRQFVQYDPNGRSFWAVDNTLAGREQTKNDREYISTFRKRVQERSMEMSVKVPLPWMLLKLVMDSKRMRYCKYSELLEVALSRGYIRKVPNRSPEADLDTMLKLFHILGLFYHKVPTGYKKEDSLVFIDPDYLYSTTSDFLMAAKDEVKEGIPLRMGVEGIVGKNRIIQRMEGNSKSIQINMETVLQKVKTTIDQNPTEVLGLLHVQLKELPTVEYQEATTATAKRQLFMRGMVTSLASSVEEVLHNSDGTGDVKLNVDKAAETVRMRYRKRFMHVLDMDHVLSILSDLRVVAKLMDSDSYVIPAALPEVPPSMDFPESAAPILMTMVSQTIMQVCYLPSGLFCCLISELVTGLGWTVTPLGRTHVAFKHESLLTGCIHLIEHESYIEIRLESVVSLQEFSQTRQLQTVRENVHKSTVRILGDLYSDPTSGGTFESLVWGFQCREHPSHDTHIAAVHEGDNGYYAECMLQGCSALQTVTEVELVWASAVDFKLTKCVTIQAHDVGFQCKLKPIEECVQYNVMQYVTPEQTRSLNIHDRSDWKSVNNGDVLLHIDVQSQQVYPLPLLIMPVQCIYLIAFNLPEGKEEEEKALKSIHDALKDLYTYTSYGQPGRNEEWCHSPMVFLVGLQREQRDCSAFAQALSEMLERSAYKRLLVPPEGNDPYWINHGTELNIHDDAALLSKIQCYCYQPTQHIRQSLVCHCELVQSFEEVSFILYEEAQVKMANVLSGICINGRPDVKKFLNCLHKFGLIFYCSELPGLAQSDNVVLLRPQYLCRVFEEVLELSKKKQWVSIADLFASPNNPIPRFAKNWFQAVCVSMNLVIELPTGDRTDYVFVMSLGLECDLPSREHYSVNPLLVTYWSQDYIMHNGGDCYLPSSLFPAFVSTFLKELKEYIVDLNKDEWLTDPQPITMKRHYCHAGIRCKERGVVDIHVVERESFIEIGLQFRMQTQTASQQFHWKTINQTKEQQSDKLQLFCQGIQRIISKSAEGACDWLRLKKSSIHYYEEVEANKIEIQGMQSHIATDHPRRSGPGQADEYPKEVGAKPFASSHLVSQLLTTYEDEFLDFVNAKHSLRRLHFKGVISQYVRANIELADDEEARYILFEHLEKNATVDMLRVYCGVAIAAVGFPRMQALGKKMMETLSPGKIRSSVSPPPVGPDHAEEHPKDVQAKSDHTSSSEVGDPTLQSDEFKLTKCITIQTQNNAKDGTKLSHRWKQYSPGSSECKKSGLKLPGKGTWLLHIDIPNQQLCPLPLLITPVHCVYLITFNVPQKEDEEETALKAIDNVIKDVYAYSKGLEACTDLPEVVLPEVFLLGLDREEVDRRSFAQHLRKMLDRRSYSRLIVFPEGEDAPYWTNCGSEHSIYDNSTLLSKIQLYSSVLKQPICQLRAQHSKLLESFKDDPFVPYKDVEDTMAAAVSGTIESSNLEDFLKLLHSYGLIFYRSLPDLEESERVVVPRPQNLVQVFEEVQKGSKQREFFTITDLLKTTAIDIRDKEKWFQEMCMSMGLVIERSIADKPDYVFVMGLKPECNPPEREHYSVNPLLVTYKPKDIVQQKDDFFLPSRFFPKFVTTFLKKLKKEDKMKKEPNVLNLRHLHVSVPHATQIHVIERDSFLEIGLQQFYIESQTEGEPLDILQGSCQDIYGIVSDSAKCAAEKLKLDSSRFTYGFLYRCESNLKIDCFGEFDPKEGTLTCSCCNAMKGPTPQQQIWFSKINPEKVFVERVKVPMGKGESMIRKLMVAVPVCQAKERGSQSVIPSLPPSVSDEMNRQPKIVGAIAAASSLSVSQLLATYEDEFLEVVNAKQSLLKLKHKGVISPDVRTTIDNANDEDAKYILFEHLEKNATMDTLRVYCDVAIAADGYPRMQALGKKMMEALQPKATPQGRVDFPIVTRPTFGARQGVQPKSTPPTLPVDVPPQPTPTPSPIAVPAEQVLKHFLYRFIEEVDARAIAFNLKIEDIISQGVEADIYRESGVKQQNQILYSHLKAACTQEALMKVCEVMIAVQGHPKMKQLGKEMKSMLEGTSGGAS